MRSKIIDKDAQTNISFQDMVQNSSEEILSSSIVMMDLDENEDQQEEKSLQVDPRADRICAKANRIYDPRSYAVYHTIEKFDKVINIPSNGNDTDWFNIDTEVLIAWVKDVGRLNADSSGKIKRMYLQTIRKLLFGNVHFVYAASQMYTAAGDSTLIAVIRHNINVIQKNPNNIQDDELQLLGQVVECQIALLKSDVFSTQVINCSKAVDEGKPIPRFFECAQSDETADSIEEKYNPMQKLMRHIFIVGWKRGVRRDGSTIYRPVIHGGNNTLFYEAVESNQQFVWSSVSPIASNLEEFSYATANTTNAKMAASFLEQVQDESQIPFIKQKQHYFSFANGIFDAGENVLHLYADATFQPGTSSIATLPQGISTANFFDYSVPLEYLRPDFSARNIPTPNFDKILDTQGWDEHDKDALYSCLGRTVHKVGKIDNLQFALYVLGVAGTSLLRQSITHSFLFFVFC